MGQAAPMESVLALLFASATNTSKVMVKLASRSMFAMLKKQALPIVRRAMLSVSMLGPASICATAKVVICNEMKATLFIVYLTMHAIIRTIMQLVVGALSTPFALKQAPETNVY